MFRNNERSDSSNSRLEFLLSKGETAVSRHKSGFTAVRLPESLD